MRGPEGTMELPWNDGLLDFVMVSMHKISCGSREKWASGGASLGSVGSGVLQLVLIYSLERGICRARISHSLLRTYPYTPLKGGILRASHSLLRTYPYTPLKEVIFRALILSLPTKNQGGMSIHSPWLPLLGLVASGVTRATAKVLGML